MKILVVEDDPGIGRFVKNGLVNEGYEVEWLRTGTPTISMLQNTSYGALVLDLMLPDKDGYDICREIRAAGMSIPICMLTARDTLSDKLEGFQAGTDDYLVKPFSIMELVARLRVMISRQRSSDSAPNLAISDLKIDTLAREIKVNGEVIDLTRREFEVLSCLAEHAGNVVSRDKLIDAAWGNDAEITPNSVDVYIGYIRRKLRAANSSLEIQTIRGIGFKMIRKAE